MGRPKAWLPFGEEILLTRVVRCLIPAVETVVVVGAPGVRLPPLLPEAIRVDDEESGRGPLGGMAAGLSFLQGKVDAAFVTGCDAPFLDPRFVRRMVALLGQHDLCLPRAFGRLHPLAGVYRCAIAPVVRELLAAGAHGPIHLLPKVASRVVEEEELADIGLRSLRNVNTPEEYAAAAAEAGDDAGRSHFDPV